MWQQQSTQKSISFLKRLKVSYRSFRVASRDNDDTWTKPNPLHFHLGFCLVPPPGSIYCIAVLFRYFFSSLFLLLNKFSSSSHLVGSVPPPTSTGFHQSSTCPLSAALFFSFDPAWHVALIIIVCICLRLGVTQLSVLTKLWRWREQWVLQTSKNFSYFVSLFSIFIALFCQLEVDLGFVISAILPY